MIKNYLLTTIRNVNKHKFFSIINILGLSVGIACSLFITLYILDEFSYDKFNDAGDRIYRVTLDAKLGEQEVHAVNAPNKLPGTLMEEVSAVQYATTTKGWGSTSFLYEDKKFIEKKAIVVDSCFLDVFSYKMLHGNRRTALDEPNSVVLTKSMAIKYFGDEKEALGKLMVVDGDSISFKVTGVLEDVPHNSHLKFTSLLSKTSFKRELEDPWINNSNQIYYVLKEGATVEEVNEQMEVLTMKYISPMFKMFMGKDLAQLREAGGQFEYGSQPLYDIHLKNEYQGDLDPQGDIKYIYILIAIGVFILVIASINFMNLSTAKSANRAKEVGLRKTMGATKGQMIGQFLTESMFFSVVSALLALLLLYLFIPSFNQLTGKELAMQGIFNGSMLSMMLTIVLFVGLLAGSYPAFYLTSFEIIDVLKGKLNAGSKNKTVRGALVTFQFWISIGLIISTAVVYQQLSYTQNQKIGIDKDQVLYIASAFRLGDDRQTYKNKIEAIPQVDAVSFTNSRFPGVNSNSIFGLKGREEQHLLANMVTDEDFQTALGFKMKEGRFFSEEFKTDSNAVVINEAAVKLMSLENPLKEVIVDKNPDGSSVERHIIGVMEDFNFESLKEEIRPLMIRNGEFGHSIAIRFNGQNYKEVINRAQQEWDQLVPDEPFEYLFMSETYDEQFRAEQRLKQLFTILTGLAIFIACLGLFGLTAFTAEQRTKEIGIRKALGASVWQINTLLTKEFNKFVLIAFALAIFPVYYLMNGWLENFAFRISLSVWVFAMGGITALIISWITVSYQAQKAAQANPVKALKYE